jgi:hypothetical protein
MRGNEPLKKDGQTFAYDEMNAKFKTLIYYHCINGHDRTSALTACYMMKYMGPVYTFNYVTTTPAPQGAVLQNNHGVKWNPPYLNLVQYYYNTYIPQPM